MFGSLRTTFLSVLVIAVLLLFLFRGIIGTYAYTDGYEFLWNCTNADFLKGFIQQGRAVSGWIVTLIYPAIDHVVDLSKVRVLNLICLFVSCVLIYFILKQNGIRIFHALAIVIIFICSPFSSIVVHWEATSSAIWGFPIALISGQLVYTAYFNMEAFSKRNFNLFIYTGMLLGIVSLFIYQPSYTAFIFPSFLHFITGKKNDVIRKSLLLHVLIYGIYFLLLKFQLNQLDISPDKRAGIGIGPVKVYLLLKGVILRSLHYNVIFVPMLVRIIISIFSLGVIGYWTFLKIRNSERKEKWNFIFMLLMFYTLAYFPNFISADNFIAYRTLGTVTLLSSFLLITAIADLPLRGIYKDIVIACAGVIFVCFAWYNNKTFTTVQIKEYTAVKAAVEENLKSGYPQKVLVIRAEEQFLVNQNLVPEVVTDEFGKLSNSVHWTPEPFVKHILYDLTNERAAAQKVEIENYKRSEIPANTMEQYDWVLDIEKIYSSR